MNEFFQWLANKGLAQSTIDVYTSDVQYAQDWPGGVRKCLLDRELAPLTKHRVRAALRAWATFQGDDALLEQLTQQNLKLPAPMRVTVKKPFTDEEWKALREEIDKATYLEPAVRAVLGLLAVRGFRVGDILRLSEKRVRAGLKTSTLLLVAKGGRNLEFGLRDRMRTYLEIFIAETGWDTVANLVCPHSPERTVRRSARHKCWRNLRTIAVACDIDPDEVYTHRFRRTYANAYILAIKNDPRALTKLKRHMGWSSLLTAEKYVDFLDLDELEDIGDTLF